MVCYRDVKALVKVEFIFHYFFGTETPRLHTQSYVDRVEEWKVDDFVDENEYFSPGVSIRAIHLIDNRFLRFNL